MIQKKISRFMGIAMGITLSFVMSIIGSLMGTLRSGHFTVPAFLGSFCASFALTAVIAVGLGFIVPMKKINDGIENKTKATGMKLHLFQSLASDLIYTTIICLVMSFFSTAVFSMPGAKRGMDEAITSISAEIKDTEAKIAEIKAKGDDMTPADKGELEGLNGKIGALNGELKGKEEAKEHMQLVPMALGSFATSYPLELIIALIVIMIVEPKYQKKAFKKYIPGYGENIDADLV